MEIIAKISKGTKMDQIYIPKNRAGLATGSYVIIKQLATKEAQKPLYFYNTKSLEPIKSSIINEIISIIDKNIDYSNIIFTGSFLDKGFNFKDIDILLITQDQINIKQLTNKIENAIKISTHIIKIDNEALINGLKTDPLYQMMLSKCVAKKRFIYKKEHKINYKILDLHLLKSKLLIDNFDILNGNEKYKITRNMIAIVLYLNRKKISKDSIDKEIIKAFNLDNIKKIKQNILEKGDFLRRYKNIYAKTFNTIMKGIKNASKQK